MFSFGREVGVALGCLQYLALSFGGVFEREVNGEKDNKVTHFVMDRPVSAAFLDKNKNKEFV